MSDEDDLSERTSRLDALWTSVAEYAKRTSHPFAGPRTNDEVYTYLCRLIGEDTNRRLGGRGRGDQPTAYLDLYGSPTVKDLTSRVEKIEGLLGIKPGGGAR